MPTGSVFDVLMSTRHEFKFERSALIHRNTATIVNILKLSCIVGKNKVIGVAEIFMLSVSSSRVSTVHPVSAGLMCGMSTAGCYDSSWSRKAEVKPEPNPELWVLKWKE